MLIFSEVSGTLNTLYDILKSFFLEENETNKDYKRQFTLGKHEIVCLNQVAKKEKLYFLLCR